MRSVSPALTWMHPWRARGHYFVMDDRAGQVGEIGIVGLHRRYRSSVLRKARRRLWCRGADGVVLRRNRAAPGRCAQRTYAPWARIEHVRTVGDHDDHRHFGAQDKRTTWRERTDLRFGRTIGGDTHTLEQVDARVNVAAAEPVLGGTKQQPVARIGKVAPNCDRRRTGGDSMPRSTHRKTHRAWRHRPRSILARIRPMSDSNRLPCDG